METKGLSFLELQANTDWIDEFEPEIAGEIVVCDGPFEKTIIYYKGHQPLMGLKFMNGEHVLGWTGPETRVESKTLKPYRTLDVVESNEEVLQDGKELILSAHQG